MPLVFVHGVANRPTPEQMAEKAQRDALFRSLTFGRDDLAIFNPDWGSGAARFSAGLPWLPDPDNIQAFGAGANPGLPQQGSPVGLGEIAKKDAVQAVDLAVLAALEEAIEEAGAQPEAAANTNLIAMAAAAADYVEPLLVGPGQQPVGKAELAANNDEAFAAALGEELDLASAESDIEAFGIGDRIRDAVGSLGRWIGNGISDAALRRKRGDLSAAVAMFLGDIFVYLRNRDIEGAEGTADRLFKPILDDLIAASSQAAEDEPLVVVSHSLGGVLLYDMLTDARCLQRLAEEAPNFRIDTWVTVGSQPGFFADLGMYVGRSLGPSGKLAMPGSVTGWMNVYDYTDVLSFLCAPFFDGVKDYGYDTVVDVVHAHSAYFRRPSFYKRLQVRLRESGHL
jgi:hypothetical protein